MLSARTEFSLPRSTVKQPHTCPTDQLLGRAQNSHSSLVLGHSEMPTFLASFPTRMFTLSLFLGYFSIGILPKFNFQMKMLVLLLTSPFLYTVIMKGNKRGHYHYFHWTLKRTVTQFTQRLKGLFPVVLRLQDMFSRISRLPSCHWNYFQSPPSPHHFWHLTFCSHMHVLLNHPNSDLI